MNENWVLSAGHCCAGIGDVGEIVAGTNNRYSTHSVTHQVPFLLVHELIQNSSSLGLFSMEVSGSGTGFGFETLSKITSLLGEKK